MNIKVDVMRADLIVVGAGASGLVGAIAAARQCLNDRKTDSGKPRILVLERMDRPGKSCWLRGTGGVIIRIVIWI